MRVETRVLKLLSGPMRLTISMGRQAGEKLWVRGVNPMNFQNRMKVNISFIHFSHGPPTVTRLLVDDVNKKLSLSFSVLKLEQLVQLHSPSRPVCR